jgi:four helix bundle protein
MQDFRQLNVWQKGHALALGVYAATHGFPRDEIYGLMSQLRRAAVSVGANIAEGCGRNSRADFGRFLHIAMGSASELQYLLLVARDLKYLKGDQYEVLDAATSEVKRMLASLIKRVSSRRASETDD